MSAYRSYERQADLFNSSVEELMEQGMTYREAYYKTHEQVAIVNYSEHHTGLAVDIVGKTIKCWMSARGEQRRHSGLPKTAPLWFYPPIPKRKREGYRNRI